MSLLKNANKKTKAKSKSGETLTLLSVPFVVETLLFLVACILALIFDLKSKSFYALSLTALCSGACLSAFISVRKIKKNGLMNGILYCLPSNVIFIVLSAALNAFEIDFFMVVSFLLLVFASATGGVLSVNFKSKTKIKR